MNRVTKPIPPTRLLAAIVALSVTAAFSVDSAVAEQRPVAVVSFTDYDSLTKDVVVISELLNDSLVAQFLDRFLTSVGVEQLTGLDTSQPWGINIFLNNGKPEVLAFASVTDFNAFTEALVSSSGGQVQPQRDGIFTVWSERGQFFLKHENGFAFLVQNPGQLGRLPQDPRASLGELPQTYDVAVRLNAQEIPDLFRQLAIAQIRAGFEQNPALTAGLNSADEQTRASLVQSQLETLETLIRELNQITIGVQVDGAGNVRSDVAVTGIPNGRFAAQAALQSPDLTRFSGFTVDNPTAEFRITTATGDEDSIRQGIQGLDLLKSQAFAAIDNDQELPDDVTREQFKAAVGQLIDVLGETLQAGVFDAGGAIHAGLSDDAPTGVFGIRVSNGRRVEQAVNEIIRLGQSHAEFPSLETFRLAGPAVTGVRFPLDGLQGKPLNALLGFGDDAVYFAFGNNADARLTESIERSSPAQPGTDSSPLSVTFRLGHLAVDSPALQQAVGDQDQITMTAATIQDGVRYTINMQHGIIRGIHASAKAAIRGVENQFPSQ